MLCAICISMFQNPELKGRHHKDMRDLTKAAAAGCKICINMIYVRDRDGPDEASEATAHPFMTYEFDKSPRTGVWSIRFVSSITWVGKWSARIDLASSPIFQVPVHYAKFLNTSKLDLEKKPWRVREDGFPKASIPLSTGHPDVAQVALRWFNTCRLEHANCETHDSSRNPNWYPKRLLDLSGTKRSPHLIETGLAPPKDKFASLSHCWGSRPTFLTLRSDNLELFKKEIPFKSLPKSFQDAIVTCRRLGIKYLWIDSLCILQSGHGSEADWLEHAVDMRQVCLNCTLNISIDRASCAEEGAFTTRNTNALQPCHVNWNYSGSDQALWTVYGNSDTAVEFHLLPLWKRAWVAQERLFSPRVLHFANDRIHWECSISAVSAVNEYSFHCYGNDSFGRFNGLIPPPFKLGSEIRGTNSDKLDSSWCYSVILYTVGRLSFPEKDRLIAFAGISQKLEQMSDSRYIAGFFHHQLPWALLWQARFRWREAARTYMAPSFSWAGFSGSVQPIMRRYLEQGLMTSELLAEVCGIRVDLFDKDNRHGKVSFAELQLRGVLLPWSYASQGPELSTDDLIHMCTSCSTWAVDFNYDNGTWEPIPHNERNDPQEADGALTVHPDYIEVFADHANQLYIFPIIECIRDRAYDIIGEAQPDGKHHPASHGLILKQTHREGEYERVGAYHASHLLGKSAMRAGHPEQLVSII